MKTGRLRASSVWLVCCTFQVLSWAQPAPSSKSPIPYKEETQSITDLSWRLGLSLLVCAALAGGAVYALRRRFPGLALPRVSSDLEVVERRALNTKQSLVIVRWRDTLLLVGASEGGMTLLDRKYMGDTSAAASSKGSE